MSLSRIVLLLVLCVKLCAEKIETFYGPIEVEEPVLLELIHSPSVQRLKGIHQYGIAYYTTHQEEYNRYDHSLGVFAVLRMKGASLEEQISGVLHDVSHTVFSHVGDWVFGKEYQEIDYQSTILKLYLAVSGTEDILNKYGYTIEQILPKGPNFTMLEQSLPNLSGDRIDYNIQGAYFQNFLTKQECLELVEDLQFIEGKWVTSRKDLAAKLMHFSLFMTEDCWGSAINYATSRWLAEALLKGLQIGLISWNDFHFGSDDVIWNKLTCATHPYIQRKMQLLMEAEDHVQFVSPAEADVIVRFRCRGVDPWVVHQDKIVRLSWIDLDLAQAFHQTKERSIAGIPIKFYDL